MKTVTVDHRNEIILSIIGYFRWSIWTSTYFFSNRIFTSLSNQLSLDRVLIIIETNEQKRIAIEKAPLISNYKLKRIFWFERKLRNSTSIATTSLFATSYNWESFYRARRHRRSHTIFGLLKRTGPLN